MSGNYWLVRGEIATSGQEFVWGTKDEILSEWTDVTNKKLLSMFSWELLGNNKVILFLPENEHSQCKKKEKSHFLGPS